MLRRIVISLFATTLVVLSACSEAVRSPVAGLAGNPGGTGVYSALPDTFQNTHIGTTIFNNKNTKLDTSAWRINAFSERQLAGALRQAGVPNVSVLSTPNRVVLSSVKFGKRADAALAPVFAAARAANLDQVAILEPGASLSQINNRVGTQPPYGYFSASALGKTVTQFEYVDVYLKIYDVDTQEKQQTTPIYTRAIASELSLFTVEHTKAISGVPFRENAASYSASEKRQLETAIKRRFRDNLTNALQP